MEWFELFGNALKYDFIQRALVSGLVLSVTTSLLGVFLVLRRMSLISDGLSHVSFGAVALSLFMGLPPLYASIPLVILASLAIGKLSEKKHLYGDAAIGLVSAFSIAAGVIIISMSKGFNIDIYSYLFGSILAISDLEMVLSVVVSAVVVTTIILFFNELFLLTSDEDYARVSRVNMRLLNLMFSVIQSVTIVIGIKIVGAMLMSSLIIFPAVTSLQVSTNFRKMILLSILISMLSVAAGILLSFAANTPTGATIVVINSIFFLVFFFINKVLKIK